MSIVNWVGYIKEHCNFSFLQLYISVADEIMAVLPLKKLSFLHKPTGSEIYKRNTGLVVVLLFCCFFAKPSWCQNPSGIGDQDSIREFAYKTLEDCMQRKRIILADPIGGQFRVDAPSDTGFYIYELSIPVEYIELELPDDVSITLQNRGRERILPPIPLPPGESLLIPFKSKTSIRDQQLRVILRRPNTNCSRVSTSNICGEDVSALQYVRGSTSVFIREVFFVLSFLQEVFKNCSQAPSINFIDDDIITAPLTSMIYLRCISSGFPPPSVQWYHISADTNRGRTPSSSRNTGFAVASVEVNTSDRYVCQSENEVGIDEKYVTVMTFDQECGRKYSSLTTTLANALYGNCAIERIYRNVGYISPNTNDGDGFITSINIAEPVFFRSDFIISDVEVKLALRGSDLSFFGKSARSKRELSSLIYAEKHPRVVFSHDFTELNLNPPVLYKNNSDFTQARASVYHRNPALREVGSAGTLSAVVCARNPNSQCENYVTVIGNLLQDRCFNHLDSTIMENISTKFLIIQRCTNVSFGEPYLSYSSKQLVRKPIKSVFYVTCPVKGTLFTEWLKDTPNGLVSKTTNYVLSIKNFSSTDEGRYKCQGYGSKGKVTSKPVYFILEGYTTYLIFVELDGILDTDVAVYIKRLFNGIAALRPGDIYPFVNQTAKVHVTLKRNNQLSRDQQIIPIIQDIQSKAERINPVGVIRNVFSEPISYCPEDVVILFGSLSVTFPETVFGKRAVAKETCGFPSNEVPLATRQCSGDFLSPSVWEELIIASCPNYNKTYLHELVQNVADERFVGLYAEGIIKNLAENVKNFNHTIDTLDDVAEVLEAVAKAKIKSATITRAFVEVIDFVLDLPEEIYDESLQQDAPNRILEAFETQVTTIQGLETNLTEFRNNIGLFAVKVEPRFSNTVGIATMFTSELKDNTEPLSENNTAIFADDSGVADNLLRALISIPIDTVSQDVHLSVVPVSFFVFRKALLFQSPVSNISTQQVDGMVVSATVEGHTITELSLETPVIFKVYPIHENESFYDRTAVYWRQGNRTSVWSSNGCVLQSRAGSTGSPIHESHCKHLTNFAVLLNRHGNIESTILDTLSIVGCVISIVALTITVFTFLYHREFRSQKPKQILTNLCVSLMGLYLAFLIGIERKPSKPTATCILSGAFIHYFTLTSMVWMSVEATNMYLLFWKVFDAHVSKFLMKSIFIAWGLPAFAVGLIAGIEKDIYVNDTYCFLQPNSWAFYFGLFLPLAVLLLYNFVVFCLVLSRLMCQKSKANSVRHSNNQSGLLKRFQSTAAILTLLGLTWTFGFLSLRENRFIYNLLFCIFNTLQGLFIFLLFCLRQKDVREFWWRMLTCGLKCGRDKKNSISASDFSKKTGKVTIEIDDQAKTKSPQKTQKHAVTAEFNMGIPVLK